MGWYPLIIFILDTIRSEGSDFRGNNKGDDYYCPTCKETLKLTQSQILKHRGACNR